LEITEIRITLRDDDKLRGFASITLDDCFVIRGLKIIEGSAGMFVAMPNRRRKDGTFQDIAHPINARTREMMESLIITAYKEEYRRSGGSSAGYAGSPGQPDSGRVDCSAFEESF